MDDCHFESVVGEKAILKGPGRTIALDFGIGLIEIESPSQEIKNYLRIT